MNKKVRINEIKEIFKERVFTSHELYNFYLQKEPNLKKTTFRWRVYSLKKKGVIYSIKKGVYLIGNKKIFEPVIPKKLFLIYKKIKSKFPYCDICIWNVNWLNDFTIHQPISNNIIIEIDKYAAESIFYFLQTEMENLYLNPNNTEIEKYIQNGKQNVILKNIIVDSPVEKKRNIIIPKIEKIIVDLFVEKDLFSSYHGEELKNIYYEIFNRYSINFSTLKRYANRRNVYLKIEKFLYAELSLNINKLFIG
ncbi:MAG: hypothetical protein M0R46_03405 [Candidatus Muirbacterium halophilum]|nr:hypothetical protein [Candidatus Muirbacterium halophilum]MCK9474936.1 hypothetical protein [Candidatus Muirbacterium halophilum]